MSSGYHGGAFVSPDAFREDVDKMIVATRKAIENHGINTLAFRGVSGCAYAFPIALALGLKVAYVRKEHEQSHGVSVERMLSAPGDRYAFIDDFIFSGKTLREVVVAMGSNPAAIILRSGYNDAYTLANPDPDVRVRIPQYNGKMT